MNWPQMMRKTTAAKYLDMSEASFAREVQAGKLPDGIQLGGRMHWRRDALDAAIDRLTGGHGGKPEYLREFEDRYGGKAA